MNSAHQHLLRIVFCSDVLEGNANVSGFFAFNMLAGGGFEQVACLMPCEVCDG